MTPIKVYYQRFLFIFFLFQVWNNFSSYFLDMGVDNFIQKGFVLLLWVTSLILLTDCFLVLCSQPGCT